MMKGYISGATGFLGQILARHFIDTGVSLTISGRNKGELEDLRKNLLERAALDNASIGLHVLDFSKPDDFSKQFDEIDISSFDWCINAAGDQGKIESDLHLSLSDYQEALAINLLAPIELSRQFNKQFASNKKGKIIHFSGGGSTNARPYFSPYSISKTALVRYVENTALELKNQNVQMFLISPGLMPSKMLSSSLDKPEFLSTKENLAITSAFELDTTFDGKRILSLVDFLLTDSANFCSGKLISAQWDNWSEWTKHEAELETSDLYTLRRITSRDRGQNWGDL